MSSILGASFRHRGTENSLRNKAYLQIKKKIISGTMPPASLVNEAELIAELKIGYTPIRQALRQLAHENLVVILPRRGTMVADVNASDLQKIYDIRIFLVPHAFRVAAKRASARQIHELESYLGASRSIVEGGTVAQLLEVDGKVQRMVTEASQNEFLVEVLDRLYNQARRFWRADQSSVEDHRKYVAQYREIVLALKAKDGARAARLMRRLMMTFHKQQMAGI